MLYRMRLLRGRLHLAVPLALLVVATLLYFESRSENIVDVQPPARAPSAFQDSISNLNLPKEAASSTVLAVQSESPSSPAVVKHANRDRACASYPRDSDVVIVLKTGATEASRKIPAQLLSFLSCAKDDILIFSDLEEDLGDYHVYDILDSVVDEAKFNNTDFDLYDLQKQYVREGGDMSVLTSKAHESWALDKYKNIHTAQKAWELRPNKSWYFFIDADTYIVWSSFFSWLRRWDPKQKLYLGAQVPSEDVPFAHGGSGYALSRALVEELAGAGAKDLARRYDIAGRTACCGDVELAKILGSINIPITDAHPMINGEKPRRYRFGPKLWCQPMITMHHIYAEEMRDFWQFETRRSNPKEPLLFEELFSSYLMPIFPNTTLNDWDNLSEEMKYERPSDSDAKASKPMFGWKSPDPHPDSYKSQNDCQRACKEIPECFQWVYSYEKCYLSKSFKLGGRRMPEGNTTWNSGWEFDRIESFRRHHSPCSGTDYRTYPQ